jgi:hypothetical protein
MTYKPLTEDRGAELLTLYLAAFPARTLVQQEKVMDWTESEAECGTKWRGWLAKLCPDTFLWKTAQCSLIEGEQELLQTLPCSGMTADGMLWERQTLVHGTKESECGFWPTPNASDATRGSPELPKQKIKRGANTGWSLIDVLGYMPHPEFVEWLMGWPVGWTDLKPLEMDKSPCVLQQHGIS